MILFETKRLFIRRLEDSDLESFYDMQGNPNVMRYIKKTMSFEESKQELNRFIGYYESTDIFFKIWAVIERNSNQFLGICGVYENDRSEFEIAYRLRECFWGNGFGSEIAKGLFRYCFDQIKLNELTAYVSTDNVGSIRILEKEMNYVEEFYAEKENSIERKYTLKK
ncbi:hypothetical protein ATO12_17600 [Aquimarina atlantica]|uniref:N-acetyltransferase domain-containing protein n=1 Tax=Aquimarina atlantica TaxID=1317122 RepID=A0A023BUU5_9FLAO|nr:GNAT family N-acetyltransferase [Aquimarina atlantica]EZH73750.1 hypothetical protein ATO12_17600 [Aquimarina atlantica]